MLTTDRNSDFHNMSAVKFNRPVLDERNEETKKIILSNYLLVNKMDIQHVGNVFPGMLYNNGRLEKELNLMNTMKSQLISYAKQHLRKLYVQSCKERQWRMNPGDKDPTTFDHLKSCIIKCDMAEDILKTDLEYISYGAFSTSTAHINYEMRIARDFMQTYKVRYSENHVRNGCLERIVVSLKNDMNKQLRDITKTHHGWIIKKRSENGSRKGSIHGKGILHYVTDKKRELKNLQEKVLKLERENKELRVRLEKMHEIDYEIDDLSGYFNCSESEDQNDASCDIGIVNQSVSVYC